LQGSHVRQTQFWCPVCGKFSSMCLWREVYTLSLALLQGSPVEGEGEGQGSNEAVNDEIDTLRVNGMLRVIIWDAEKRERRVVPMRWGFPKPPTVPGSGYVTNVRNTTSNFWKPWLKAPAVTVGKDIGGRCIVPVAKFAKPDKNTGLKVNDTPSAPDPIPRCSPSPGSGAPGRVITAPRPSPMLGSIISTRS
jgi:putative SOS response-associated peptidase YedK